MFGEYLKLLSSNEMKRSVRRRVKYFRVGFKKIVFSKSEDLLGKHIPRFPSVKQCCDTLCLSDCPFMQSYKECKIGKFPILFLTRMAKLDAMTLWFLLERICDA